MDKSIIVAVDGSEPALEGLRFAAPIARAMGAELELVYAAPPNLLLPDIYPEAHRRVEEEHASAAAQVLRQAHRLAIELNVPASTHRLAEGGADAVADRAKADRVWAVVVGARGHNALARVMLGSFADRLVHVCPKPVLLVR
jgi:nucleotide-binding universal stress UspA family protein